MNEIVKAYFGYWKDVASPRVLKNDPVEYAGHAIFWVSLHWLLANAVIEQAPKVVGYIFGKGV
jgi:hypothetical protein